MLCINESDMVQWTGMSIWRSAQRGSVLDDACPLNREGLTQSGPANNMFKVTYLVSQSVSESVSWCFKPSQSQRIISRLKETFIKRYLVERTTETSCWEIYGMKCRWKGHKDRNRHKNRVKESGQAGLVYVKNINRNVPTTWRWARRDHKTRHSEKLHMEQWARPIHKTSTS